MLDLRELAIPVVGAPMAGGPSTVALVTAISRAGGLGFLAGGYKTATQMAGELERARAASSGPVGVNLFLVTPYQPDEVALARYRASLFPEASQLGVELGELRWDDDDWRNKVEVVLELRPEAVSFTFGCPSSEVLHQLATRKVLSAVTVTTVAEAQKAAGRGASSLVVQGPDAGGHRGTWDLDAVPNTLPLPELVRAVVSVVDVPVIAGGGVSDAASARQAINCGASGVQAGTAYLLAHEAGTAAVHRAALTDSQARSTGLTRAYSGRWARGITNRFMADHHDAPPGYPHLHHLTAPLRRAAVAAGDAQVAHLWAGTGYRQARPASAEEITRSLDPA